MADKLMKDYKEWANKVVDALRADTSWEKLYDGYAKDLLKNRDLFLEAKGKFREHAPLHFYLTIGKVKSGKTDFDVRYLGQSVGTVSVKGDDVKLSVSKEQADHSKKYFGYMAGAVSGVSWSNSKFAREFRKFYKDGNRGLPRQKEHMVESALFSEIGKRRSANKTLCNITPVQYVGRRIHMKTAVKASKAGKKNLIEVSDAGGEIDLFCRRSIKNGRGESRLVVIEIKDENRKDESFDSTMKQAVSYAVFIRELIHSKAGNNWMELWGMKNQKKTGFTIDCVVAMPKGETRPSYTGKEQPIPLENDDGSIDHLKLHYLEITSQIGEDSAEDVLFSTSMSQKESLDEIK